MASSDALTRLICRLDKAIFGGALLGTIVLFLLASRVEISKRQASAESRELTVKIMAHQDSLLRHYMESDSLNAGG